MAQHLFRPSIRYNLSPPATITQFVFSRRHPHEYIPTLIEPGLDWYLSSLP